MVMRIAILLLMLGAACRARLPEESMTAKELVDYYGYPFEEFDCVTPDGYVLKLHRIPFGTEDKSPSKPRPVFFLQHGLLASSTDWITNLPAQSLGFMLADMGFDVWMGNSRGNVYSRDHVNLTRQDKQYWEFTWDEMAKYDLPTMIDTTLNITKQNALYYVGHSQGTAIMFAHLSEDQNFAKKIHKFFALAPVATIHDIKGVLAFLGKHLSSYIWIFEKLFGSHEFLPGNWMLEYFARLTCGATWESPTCENFLFQIGGPESNQFNKTRLMVYLSHTPAGTSTWNVLHWAQMYSESTFKKFDFGTASLNRQHYGKRSPPKYNLSRVNVKTYLYYSNADWLADSNDVEKTLIAKIPSQFIMRIKKLVNFNHFDFIWGLNAPTNVYREIIKIAMIHRIQTKKLSQKV